MLNKPFSRGCRIGRQQCQVIDRVVLAERPYIVPDPSPSDKRFPAGKDQCSGPANLIDKIVHLTPCEFVSVRISQLVEAIDGHRYESMPHQYRELIERDRQAKALQAERDQILEERKHAPPALYVKNERRPVGPRRLKKLLGA